MELSPTPLLMWSDNSLPGITTLTGQIIYCVKPSEMHLSGLKGLVAWVTINTTRARSSWVPLSFLSLSQRIQNYLNEKRQSLRPKSLRCDTFHCSALEKRDVCVYLPICLPASSQYRPFPFFPLSPSALRCLRISLALSTIHDPISREASSSACDNTQTLV